MTNGFFCKLVRLVFLIAHFAENCTGPRFQSDDYSIDWFFLIVRDAGFIDNEFGCRRIVNELIFGHFTPFLSRILA